MSRKSVSPKEQVGGKPKIIVIKKDESIIDYLPKYQFSYDVEYIPSEPLEMGESFENFLKENESLVIEDYKTNNKESIQEGFKRAVALTMLFFKSLYLDK